MRGKLEELLHGQKIRRELRKLAAEGQKSLELDFDILLGHDMELAKHLLERPGDFLEVANEILEDITKIPKCRLRIRKLDKTMTVREIRSEHVGRFIQVEGVLTRASEIKPEIREAVFKCLHCDEETTVPQTEEIFRKPLSCENPNCGKKGPFKLVVESSEFLDWQSLRIQERPEELRGGQMPRQLDAIIRDDFVDKATPGNRVALTGTLRVFQERGKGKSGSTTFRKVLFVNHIEVARKGVEETELKPEDEEAIKELAKDKWLHEKIVGSIAPSIYGHTHIKEAIAVQLFGCSAVELPDGSRIRGDTHVLLTGDPGTAKSQILKWVSEVVPRGIYTSGKKATGAGLTAAAIRDEISGSWTLEAGALVIADGGMVSIDEFDKMNPDDSGTILESMEQQTISVAKAGIMATLNTRTAILAAANPQFGRFDKYRTISEQIDVSPVILSRFDLIFITRDEPTEEQDRKIARHMLSLQHEADKVVRPPLDIDTLRKLIIYAKRHVNPQFKSKKPLKMIEDFFVEWRKMGEGLGTIAITARQLEALVRLSKANARMRLSDTVTVEDASRAIKLIKKSLKTVGVDPETGRPDIDVIMTGQSRTQRDRFEKVMEIIKSLEADYGGAAPIDQIKRMGLAEGLSERFIEMMIEKEVERGHLYKPRENLVKRVMG